MNKNSWKLGDVVEYHGEAWYVGFENVLTFKGTYRLQKGHSAYDRQVNRVSVDEMKPVNKKRLEELSGKGDTTAKEVLKHLESCDEPLSDEELHIIRQAKYEREQKLKGKKIESE